MAVTTGDSGRGANKLIVVAAAMVLLAAGARTSRADEAFCKAYSAAAMQSQLEATRAGCGFIGGPGRWSDNERDHYQPCLTWGANTSKFAIAETNTRAQDLSACKARKLGVGNNSSLAPESKEVSPIAQLGTFCTDYAKVAVAQIRDKIGQGCQGLTGPRWDPQGQHHVDACRDWGRTVANVAGRLGAAEMNARESDLLTCRKQKQAAAPGNAGSGGAAAGNGPAGDPVPAEWADMLAAHNERRKLHCAPPLIWSNAVAASAKAWADTCTLDHQPNDPYGENFMVWAGSPVTPRQGFENAWLLRGQVVRLHRAQDRRWQEGRLRSAGERPFHASGVESHAPARLRQQGLQRPEPDVLPL